LQRFIARWVADQQGFQESANPFEYLWILEGKEAIPPSIWRYKEERGRSFLASGDARRKEGDPS
jgi:hypothetical protein